jgi:hypothetical protein
MITTPIGLPGVCQQAGAILSMAIHSRMKALWIVETGLILKKAAMSAKKLSRAWNIAQLPAHAAFR